jgi:ice-binding like protein
MKRHGLLPFLGAGALLASGSFSSLLAGSAAPGVQVAASNLLSGPGGLPLASVVPSLGSAQNFAVLAASTVTNTGATTVTGNLGISPGTALTGFPPGIVVGTIHAGDPIALQAQGDLTLAYDNLAGMACTTTLTGQDLGGLTLTPGVYCFATTAQMSGTLTLDAQGNPNAVFVFQIGSTLTTAIASSVQVINGGQPAYVFWQVGSSATLGTGTAFVGNVLAMASVTLTTGASVTGKVLARTGAVTMDTNDVTQALPAGTSTYGTSTPGCTGPLAIGATSSPQVGNASFAITCDNAPPNAAGLLGFSTRPLTSPVSILGFDVWIDIGSPDFFGVSVTSDPTGASLIPIPVPNDPAFIGGQVFAQFAWVGPSSPPPCPATGFSTSNALAIVVLQ